jgi:hypothetical protein
MLKSFIIFLSLSILPLSAFATASTHIWAPSTDVQAYEVFHTTTDYYLPTEQTPAGGRIPPVTNTGLTVGILPLQKLNAEVGIDHKSGLGGADDYPLYFNAKIGVPENSFGNWFPAAAVGIFDLGTKSDLTDYNVVYGKLAKTLGPVGRLSLGYFSGNEKLLLDAKGEKDNFGVFGAWERTMTEVSPKLWLCLEYMGTESGYGTFDVGGSWKFADNVGMVLGYDIFNNSDIPSTVTVQVDIDFSLKGK